METFSALLATCAGNSPVAGEFPAQRPGTRSFDVFFDLLLNNQLSKQSWGWWFETLSRSLSRHCNVVMISQHWIDGNKPLAEPMLTKIYIWRHQEPLSWVTPDPSIIWLTKSLKPFLLLLCGNGICMYDSQQNHWKILKHFIKRYCSSLQESFLGISTNRKYRDKLPTECARRYYTECGNVPSSQVPHPYSTHIWTIAMYYYK